MRQICCHTSCFTWKLRTKLISLSGSSGTAENNYAQCFTIVHVIVILADNGEKSVLVLRVHFFLKLKNQFMKMHLFHVHVRYVYYLLNQKNCHIKCFPLSFILYPRLIAKMSSGVLLSGTAIWEKG